MERGEGGAPGRHTLADIEGWIRAGAEKVVEWSLEAEGGPGLADRAETVLGVRGDLSAEEVARVVEADAALAAEGKADATVDSALATLCRVVVDEDAVREVARRVAAVLGTAPEEGEERTFTVEVEYARMYGKEVQVRARSAPEAARLGRAAADDGDEPVWTPTGEEGESFVVEVYEARGEDG